MKIFAAVAAVAILVSSAAPPNHVSEPLHTEPGPPHCREILWSCLRDAHEVDWIKGEGPYMACFREYSFCIGHGRL